MKILLVLLLLIGGVEAKVPDPCKSEEQLLQTRGIDLDTRTLKGWLRLLKNKSKQGTYGIYLSRSELEELIRCLSEELANRKVAGKLK